MKFSFHKFSRLLPLSLWLSLSVSLSPMSLLLAREQQEEIPAPSGFTAASSFDVVARGDTVHLLFAQNESGENEGLTLFYCRSDDAGATWSHPVRVPSSHAPPGRHLRGNDPQLAVSGERLMSLWTAEGAGPWGSGPLGASISDDGGSTWRPAPTPASGPGVGSRFPAAAADEDFFHAIWIHAEDNERSLRHARLKFDSDAWTAPAIIDGHICACCWNKIAVTADGTLIGLYRDQNPSDMGLALSKNQGADWELPGHVGTFDWRFEGCPHVGGGLVAGVDSGGTAVLLASVWTGHSEHGGAYLLRSENGGHDWQQQPVPGESFRGNSNTDIALLANGRAAVVWDMPREGTRIVLTSQSHDSGKTWSPARQLSPKDEFATHPRIIACSQHFLAFWSGTNPDGKATLTLKTIELD